MFMRSPFKISNLQPRLSTPIDMPYVEKETVMERLKHLHDSGDLSDTTFLVGPEEKKVKAHSLLYAIASPVFFHMFFGGLFERATVIKVPDITPAGFIGMARYMYTDRLPLASVDHACKVLDSARKYMMPYLEKKCLNYLDEHACPENVIKLYEYAAAYSYHGLVKRCLLILQRKTAQVVDSEEFMRAEKSTVLEITRLPKLNLPSELHLFLRIEEWAKKQAEMYGEQLYEMAIEMSDIIGSIRFLSMSNAEFASGPGKSPLLTSEEKCEIYNRFAVRGGNDFPERLSANREKRTTGTYGGPTEGSGSGVVSGLTRAQSTPASGMRRAPSTPVLTGLTRAQSSRASTPDTASGASGAAPAAFSCIFHTSALRRLNDSENIFSEQWHYVSYLPWKFVVWKWSDGSYCFYLCTPDAQKSVRVLGAFSGRILNQDGEELLSDLNGVPGKGWRGAVRDGHRDGHLRLFFGGVYMPTIDRCTSIVLEASVHE